MKRETISDAVVKRLPIYCRFLEEKLQDNVFRVSSKEISDSLGFTASQVRQDFSNFGEFGQQGFGYDVKYLRDQIKWCLGVERDYNLIIIGGGKIGQAVANYKTFQDDGFCVKAIFDRDTAKISVRKDVEVYASSSLEEYVSSHHVDIAVICTQKENAIDVANKVVSLGITAIWNFAPIDIKIEGVQVESVHLLESLMLLAYKMNFC